jgi:hypothetical protein
MPQHQHRPRRLCPPMRAAFEAWMSGDLDAMLANADPDIEWYVLPDVLIDDAPIVGELPATIIVPRLNRGSVAICDPVTGSKCQPAATACQAVFDRPLHATAYRAEQQRNAHRLVQYHRRGPSKLVPLSIPILARQDPALPDRGGHVS